MFHYITMSKFKLISTTLSILTAFIPATMQANDDAAKLSVTPIGRIHVDGAIYIPDKNGFTDGAALSEIRAGVKATYGDWLARIEIGYSYSKIGMKDVYIQKFFTPGNSLRIGYFIPQFGIRGGGSASYKPALIQQIPETFFRTTTRKIGVGYTHYDKNCYLSASAYTGGRSLLFTATQQGKLSVGISERAVWHPQIAPGHVLQLGFSSSFETASHTRILGSDGDEVSSGGFRTFSANFPTTVSSVPLLNAEVQDAKADWKISPELILSGGRMALEAQYYHLTATRKYKLPSYQANGAFGMLRFLVLGDSQYTYSDSEGALALPSPKTLELVGGYSYTDGNSHNRKYEEGSSEDSFSIRGGIASDYSLTANYYINKYMIVRLRYSYTDVRESPVAPRGSINTIQARLQFVF